MLNSWNVLSTDAHVLRLQYIFIGSWSYFVKRGAQNESLKPSATSPERSFYYEECGCRAISGSDWGGLQTLNNSLRIPFLVRKAFKVLKLWIFSNASTKLLSLQMRSDIVLITVIETCQHAFLCCLYETLLYPCIFFWSMWMLRSLQHKISYYYIPFWKTALYQSNNLHMIVLGVTVNSE